MTTPHSKLAIVLAVATLVHCGAKTGLTVPDAANTADALDALDALDGLDVADSPRAVDRVDVRDAPDVTDVPTIQPVDAGPPSYIGTDFWPVSLVNSQLGSYPDTTSGLNVGVGGFPFAIAVANPAAVPAHLTITGGALPQCAEFSVTVAAQNLLEIPLPWQLDVSQVAQQGASSSPLGSSAFVAGGAYHLTSDVPVTVYQFNPLTYEDVRRTNCDPTDDSCFTYTNDASLLLPTSALTGNYIVLSWPTNTTFYQGVYSSEGGFVAIVATADNTTVSVALTGTVRAGNGVSAAAPGSTVTQTMNAGDVWQLVSGAADSSNCTPDPTPLDQYGNDVCQPDPQLDLTGSIVVANHPVAVYGGHDCTNVPYNREACDHLEEELFPSETLGSHYVLSRTQPQLESLGDGPEPNMVRILSNADGNVIAFSPSSAHPGITLNRGQYIDMVQSVDMEVTGTGPFVAAQLLVGQNYFGNDVTILDGSVTEDPALVLEVPVEQWRNNYLFLSPGTFLHNYFNVVAAHGAPIMLDGAPINGTAATLNGYDVYRLPLGAGSHVATSADGSRFAIKVYAVAPYTAYMYPGGLDLSSLH